MRNLSWCTVSLTAVAVTSVLVAYLLGGSLDPTARDPDIDLTTVELIAKYGYPAESHTVVSEDGYILTLHRIPFGKKSPGKTKRQPVFLQHGIVSSSVDWVIMGPEKSLGYVLADAGYDVWLGNSRGNVWSSKHVTLHPSSAEFWNFSWHEMGIYDLTAITDYILRRTGQEKLSFIGYSMGATMFFAMASEKPEYNKNFNVMIALTPAMYIKYCISPMPKMFAIAGKQLEWLSNLFGVYQILPHTSLFTFIGRHFCSDGAVTQPICMNILKLNMALNNKETNTSALPLILGHAPAGASIKTFQHFGQNINSGEFRKYDYGEEKNRIVYGSLIPPKYDVSKITVPVAIMYAQNDIVTDPRIHHPC
ncbi:gastric triacylglycerol lipase isoform X2 [Anabrus simplex]|uniref:gastric triacylglycerol lipase isoform X2 n=1 Tax=Anabrus simplex TaxID=316456 RepID=UPI0035A2D0DE